MKTSRIATRPRDERDFCLLLFLLATSFFFFCVVVVKVGDGDGGGGVFRHVYISLLRLKAVVTFCFFLCVRVFFSLFFCGGKKEQKKECGRRSKKKIPKKNTYTLKTLNILL